MQLLTCLLVLGCFACLCQGADIGALRMRYAQRFWRHRYPTSSRVAFCRYGEYRRRECCYGWRYQGTSKCAPICEDGCVHGKCVGPNRCQCDKGYTGPTCNTDFNECSIKPCSHRCVNNVGSFRCFCPTSHVLLEDKVTCQWDYRCHAESCAYGCEQVGYQVRCLCPDGLKVSENGFHCEDVDECAEGLVTCPSDQRCRNTYGNYMCMCKEGFAFQLINRQLICQERDQCVAQGLVCDENAHCEESSGVSKCVCNEGYVGDGLICREVDPDTCADRPCFTGVVCTDIRLDLNALDLSLDEPVKRYRCGPCPPGYSGDGLKCFDINECDTGDYECHADARCINTQGSYRCQCNEGFIGDGKKCVPLDPTTCASRPCFEGVRCFNVPIRSDIDFSAISIVKGYRCGSCPDGYEGDGETCADRNECEEGSFVCHRNATCINRPGSYDCECDEGFAGDGRVCIPLDGRTCADRPCFPRVECEDIPLQRVLNSRNWRQLDEIRLFRCGPCPSGYRGDGETCTDTDECALGLHQCHDDAICTNLPGSYRCDCKEGFAGNGFVCVPIDPTECSDLPCFNGRVDCRDLNLQDVLAATDIATAQLIKLYECGACPAGYFGNGENCVDINECLLDLYQCHPNATCSNTDGSYDCICNIGYAGDGQRCRKIDDTSCLDNPCFPGVVCLDVPLDITGLDLDSTEPIKLYRCGRCPPGYRGNGEVCLDIDECVENLFVCPENASCVNVPGTYDCVCNEGFYGDGQTCIPLDPRTCDDQPCFEGVECTVVDPAGLDWRSMDLIRLFSCGECPPGFAGDGETCMKLPPPIIVPDFVNLTVVVTTDDTFSPLVSDAKVTALVADEKSGTVRFAEALTAFNGVTKLAVPHNRTTLLTVEHGDYLSKSVTYKAHLGTNNSVSIQMYVFNELTEFLWRPKTSRALEFGDLLRLDIPKGGLYVSNGQRVSIECRPVNISLGDSPAEGPELIAGIPNEVTGAVELTGLEVYGMTELKCLVRGRRGVRRSPRTLAPFTISMPVNKMPDKADTSPLVAWRYHNDKGYWVKEGEISREAEVSDEGEGEFRQMWQFEASNFTYSWWAFGRAWKSSSCVTVRACFDEDCRFPVDNALIELFGLDFRYMVSRYTNANGTVCLPYKTGGRIMLRAPCIDVEKEVVLADVMPPSSCLPENNEDIVAPKKDVLVGVCAQEEFIFPDVTQGVCGNPGAVDGASRFGSDFTHGNEVIYVCDDPDSSLETSTRVCQKCGVWSGQKPSCYGGSEGFDYNYDLGI